MAQAFRIRFRLPNGRTLKIKHADATGVVFDEPDPYPRALSLEFDGRTPGTKVRLDSVRQAQGWGPFTFILRYEVKDDLLQFRGVDDFSLPQGSYWCRLRIGGLNTKGARTNFTVDLNDTADVPIDTTPDPREVELVGLDECDDEIARVIDVPGTLDDGQSAREWLESSDSALRRACLLNLLARLRAFPTVGDPLLAGVRHVFKVMPDRVYASVDQALGDRLVEMAADLDDQKVWGEGEPHHPIHLKLKESIPDADRYAFRLLSFRGEGPYSVQTVTARHPQPGHGCFAEFDIDAGNPYQDVVGFLVHMGELLDGKPTNHLDLFKKLNKGTTKPFLYYRVLNA